MVNFEGALHRQAHDFTFDFDGFRVSALILETATNEELEQIRTIAQNIAQRYTAGKAARS